jgi:hypothetical protein
MIPMVMDVPGYLTGTNLAALPLMSPRTVGEAAYYGGQAAGTANRVLEPVTSRFGSTIDKMAELQSKYRDPLVYAGFGAQNIGAMQAEPTVVEEDGEFLVLSDGTKVRMPAPATEAAAPATEAAAPAAAATASADEGSIYTVGNTKAKYDPVADDFYDVNDPSRRAKELADFGAPLLGMYRGGHVQKFGNGGQPKAGYDYGNAARTFGQGLTFGFGDEIEARLRTLAAKDPNAYRKEVNRIRMMQERYAETNPLTAGGLEMAGMLGGSMLAPSLAGVRAVSNAGRVARLGAGAVDAIGQGALYSAGKAKPDPRVAGSDRMTAIREEAPRNIADFAIMSGVGSAGKRLANTRGGRAAIDFAARPVRYATRQIRR